MYRVRKKFLPTGVPQAIIKKINGKPVEPIPETEPNIDPPTPVPQVITKPIDPPTPVPQVIPKPIDPPTPVSPVHDHPRLVTPRDPPVLYIEQQSGESKQTVKLVNGKLVLVSEDKDESSDDLGDGETILEGYLNPKRKLMTKRTKTIRIVMDELFEPDKDMRMADLVYITRKNREPVKKGLQPKAVQIPTQPSVKTAPQLYINDYGQIAVDEESLRIDPLETAQILMENAVTEEDHPRSYTNYRRLISCRRRWTGPDSIRFLVALAMFGTDFSAIAGVFPGRLHRDILNKYKSGLRTNPLIINEMLRKRVKVDYDYFTNSVAATSKTNK